MAPPTNPDELELARHATALADGIERALPGWTEAAVARIADAWRPGLARELAGEAAAAGRAAVADVAPRVRALLAADVDAQAQGPLALVREAVRHPTAVLAAAGVGPVVRDEFDERAFPDDVYGLAPAAFADLDPALGELGLVWGAAKAHVVLRRRRAAPPPDG
ncbi:MAG: hypothetical protein R2702_07290 [Acidimicrobiales bacterium]